MAIWTVYFLALLIGVVSGLRTMTPLAAVGWAAHFGALRLEGTWLAFLGAAIAPWILTVAVIAELVADQLPSTPSRKTPVQFGARIVSGALCGASLGSAAGSWQIGAGVGAIGAIAGTLGGSDVRSRLAHVFRRDRAAAFIEDAVALVGAGLIVGVFG
ncbi:MAG: DUF4126 family protein [Polyangiaceae bacterium]|jgi:uncharacterized membrane protein